MRIPRPAKHLGFDVNFFCWRSFHATGDMSYNGSGTGAINGLLTAIYFHCKNFGINSPLFAFDSRKNYRKQIYPGYKDRPPKDEKDAENRKEIFRQIIDIRKIILPTIGFSNIYQQTGIEADDILAKLVRDNPHELIVITADEDLLQLVDECTWYSPATKTLMNETTFRKKYEIPPREWALAKALAGCNSDKIKGISMVGMATAIKFLNGKLGKETIAYQIIDEEKRKMRKQNGILVNLPFPKTESVEIRENQFSREGFEAICDLYNLTKLSEKADEWEMMFK